MDGVAIRSTDGSTTAKISPGNGFNLYSLTVDAVELLWADPRFLEGEASASGSGTPILFPLPGRLRGKNFKYRGREYQIDSDDGQGNAIHGFVLNRPWRVIEKTEHKLVGEFHASRDAPSVVKQWPSDFIIQCTYQAVRNGIDAEFIVTNPGQIVLPCGLGTHAYFRVPVGIGEADDAIITCPVTEHWLLEDLLATGDVNQLRETQRLDQGIRFGDLQMDDVFSGISFSDGRATATIENPNTSQRLIYRWDTACEVCVVYTPPHREAVCMEPYTLVPGGLAFETGERGLIELGGGESFSHAMEIRFGEK